MAPSEHLEQKSSLRLRHLPVNEMSNTVLVVRLDFDMPLDGIAKPSPGK